MIVGVAVVVVGAAVVVVGAAVVVVGAAAVVVGASIAESRVFSTFIITRQGAELGVV